MPVTKTAKRALRSSKTKRQFNSSLLTEVEVAVRSAKKSPTDQNIKKATSLVDRAAKNNVFHKNKAARIKSQLTKLTKTKVVTKSPKK